MKVPALKQVWHCLKVVSALLCMLGIGYFLRAVQEVDPITLLAEDCKLAGYAKGNVLNDGMVFLQEGTVKHLCRGGVFR